MIPIQVLLGAFVLIGSMLKAAITDEVARNSQEIAKIQDSLAWGLDDITKVVLICSAILTLVVLVVQQIVVGRVYRIFSGKVDNLRKDVRHDIQAVQQLIISRQDK